MGNAIEESREKIRSWFAERPPAAEELRQEVLLRAEGIDFTYEGGHHALRGMAASLLLVSLALSYWNGGRYFNPFVG